VLQGNIDEPLSPVGLAEVEELAKHLRQIPFTEAWCSDLLRAKQVSKIGPDCRPIPIGS